MEHTRNSRSCYRHGEAVRRSTIALFNGLQDEALLRKGITNKNEASVRALAYHIAGHELHHVNVIKKYYL